MLKKIRLETILREILANSELHVLAVTDSGQTLYTHEQIFNELTYNYSSYFVTVSSVYRPSTAFFVNLWLAYTDQTAANLARALAAMDAQYNPINNYDMVEKSADARKLSKETDTTTPTGGTETTSEAYVFGLNSGATGADSDRSTTTSRPLQGTKSETVTQYDNDKTGTVDGQTLTGHDVNEHILTRSGNIGVTTSAQMITQEIALRKNNLMRDYVREFVNRYCYSVGGEVCENECVPV